MMKSKLEKKNVKLIIEQKKTASKRILNITKQKEEEEFYFTSILIKQLILKLSSSKVLHDIIKLEK